MDELKWLKREHITVYRRVILRESNLFRQITREQVEWAKSHVNARRHLKK